MVPHAEGLRSQNDPNDSHLHLEIDHRVIFRISDPGPKSARARNIASTIVRGLRLLFNATLSVRLFLGRLARFYHDSS